MPPTAGEFRGHVVLTTSGIGRAIVLAFGGAGAEVAIAAGNAEKNAAVVNELTALGCRATSVEFPTPPLLLSKRSKTPGQNQ